MKVLQVYQPPDGGVANHVFMLCGALKRRGWDVEVACASGGPVAGRLRAEGFAVHDLPLVRSVSPLADLSSLVRLRGIVRRGRYSLVHAHSAKGGVVGRVASWSARTPSLYTPHAWSFLVSKTPLEGRSYRAIEAALARVTSRIICVSEGELDLGQRVLPGAGKKLRLVPNGIDLPPSAPRRETDGDVVVGTVARLARQKGISDLVRAAGRVCEERGDVRFVVAGDGPEMDALRSQVARLGLDGRFVLAGPVEEPWGLLSKLDVFVLPSLWEGMPYALLEAMGSGLPAVATDVGGVRDLIPDDAFGTVVPPNAPDRLAAAVLGYAASPGLREATGGAARERVLREYGAGRMVERTLEIYHEALR